MFLCYTNSRDRGQVTFFCACIFIHMHTSACMCVSLTVSRNACVEDYLSTVHWGVKWNSLVDMTLYHIVMSCSHFVFPPLSADQSHVLAYHIDVTENWVAQFYFNFNSRPRLRLTNKRHDGTTWIYICHHAPYRHWPAAHRGPSITQTFPCCCWLSVSYRHFTADSDGPEKNVKWPYVWPLTFTIGKQSSFLKCTDFFSKTDYCHITGLSKRGTSFICCTPVRLWLHYLILLFTLFNASIQPSIIFY